MSNQQGVSKIWDGSGPFLEIGIFALTAYQMAWTGWTFVTKTATETDKAVICLLCILLLMLGNWLLVNRNKMGVFWKSSATLIIIGIMGVSVVTSQLHFSSMFIGGFAESIKDDEIYRRATDNYNSAKNELESALLSASIADKQGNVSDAATIRRRDVAAAKESVAAANSGILEASKPSDLGDSKTTAMAKTSRFFNQDPTSFITLMWLFVAALLEIGRLSLTLASSAPRAVDVDLGNVAAAN